MYHFTRFVFYAFVKTTFSMFVLKNWKFSWFEDLCIMFEGRERSLISFQNDFHIKFGFSVSLSFFHRTTFSEFAQKQGKEARFKAIEKMREREGLYNEYMLQVRRQAKEEGISKAEKVGSSSAFSRDRVGWRWGVGALVRPLVCILEILTHGRIWNHLRLSKLSWFSCKKPIFYAKQWHVICDSFISWLKTFAKLNLWQNLLTCWPEFTKEVCRQT